MQTDQQTTKGQGKPELPTQFPNGTKVRDIYTGEINTVKCSYWQPYDGQGDYTVEFEPTEAQPTGWNKSTNLRAVEQHSPLPWSVIDWSIVSDKVNKYGNFHVVEPSRDFLKVAKNSEGALEQSKANLALIVRSVNNAEKLAEALRKLKYADDRGLDLTPSINGALAALAQWENNQ